MITQLRGTYCSGNIVEEVIDHETLLYCLHCGRDVHSDGQPLILKYHPSYTQVRMDAPKT